MGVLEGQGGDETEPPQLRPLARAVVDAELSMALDRRLRRESTDEPPRDPTH